jgi:hypothetical protein
LEFNGNIEEFQKNLLDQTFDNALFASWSLRVKYREMFIKTMIKWVRLVGDIKIRELLLLKFRLRNMAMWK